MLVLANRVNDGYNKPRMSTPRKTTYRPKNPLHNVVPFAEHLYYDRGGNVRIKEDDRIDVPPDANGLPKRDEFVRMILGSVASEFVWSTAEYDIHHIAWPHANYRLSDELFDATPRVWRERGINLLDLSRQQHDYIHLYSRPLPKPPIDVMVQEELELSGRSKLLAISLLSPEEQKRGYVDERREAVREAVYLDTLCSVAETQLGRVHTIEQLAAFTPAEARVEIAKNIGILRIR